MTEANDDLQEKAISAKTPLKRWFVMIAIANLLFTFWCSAYGRGLCFGFEWELLPWIIIITLILNLPAMIFIYFSFDHKNRSVKKCIKILFLAMVIQIVLPEILHSLDEKNFKEYAAVAMQKDDYDSCVGVNRRRWWPKSIWLSHGCEHAEGGKSAYEAY